MPSGNSARKSASRSTLCPALFAAADAAVRRPAEVVRARARLLALLRLPAAFAEVPATPCFSLRCAPSAAARVKVFPHSGQVNTSVSALDTVFGLVAVAIWGSSLVAATPRCYVRDHGRRRPCRELTRLKRQGGAS